MLTNTMGHLKMLEKLYLRNLVGSAWLIQLRNRYFLKILCLKHINVLYFIWKSTWMICCYEYLQEKDLANRFSEATAENTQRQKQMDLAQNLILQVRKQCILTFFHASYGFSNKK